MAIDIIVIFLKSFHDAGFAHCVHFGIHRSINATKEVLNVLNQDCSMAKASKLAIADEFGALQRAEKLHEVGPAIEVLLEKVQRLLRIRAGEEVRVCVLRRTRLNIGGAKAHIY